MILSSTPCNPTKLSQLLAGDLGKEESKRLEEHLSYCSKCQKQLEQMAGSRQWWESTETALRVRMHSSTTNANVEIRSESQDTKREGEDQSWLGKISTNGMLGPFRLERTIGMGGTGIVAQATDTQLNRRVAVKVLYPHLAASGAAKQRFAREAQAAAAVVHPSVVPIHAVDAEHSPPYLVMTYVPGGSLQQRLDQSGPLDLVEILRIALQIAEGLAAAHAQGLVHRDVKPANILLEAGTDRVLLTDFGLARALDDATLTASGFVAGTPPYMSPEQARGDVVDGRSDIFSVGSLLYAMAVGRAPFIGSSALHVLQQVSDRATPNVREQNERMPEWFDRLIAACHEKVPSRRIPSAEELASVLRQCLAHVQKPNAFGLPPMLASKPRSRVPALALALLLGSVVGIAFGWQTGPLWFSALDPSDTQQAASQKQASHVGKAKQSGDLTTQKTTVIQQGLVPTAMLQNENLGEDNAFHADVQMIRSRLFLLQQQLEDDWK